MARYEATSWWDDWAPFWEPLENRHLGLVAIEQLAEHIAEPVLVVGAGHGLIVGHLRDQGLEADGVDLSPAMIAMARQRRGLELYQADARALPFPDGRYQTVIIASGVIDYADDAELVRDILQESQRILRAGGKLLTGFYRFVPAMEQLYRGLGMLEQDRFRMDRVLEMNEILMWEPQRSPEKMAEWTGRSWLGCVRFLAGNIMSRPRLVRGEYLRLQAIYRLAEAAGVDRHRLIVSASCTFPYRDEAQIRALLAEAGLTEFECITTIDCIVVRHERRGRPVERGGAADG